MPRLLSSFFRAFQCYLVVGVTFKYTEISQKLVGDTEGSKTVATLSECAQFAYESNGVAIQLKQKDQSFTCVVYKNVKYVENGRNPPYQYFIADLRVQESCSAHVETVKSVTSEVSQCSVNQVICDKLKKVRTRPLCPKDPQPDDRCCPEDHTGACFEELTITYGSCIYADTHNPYSVAIAKMEGTKLYWITDFVNIPGEAKVLTRKARVAITKAQLKEATHAVIDFDGYNDFYVTRITVDSPNAKLEMTQRDCDNCGAEEAVLWVAQKFTYDAGCNAYRGNSTHIFTIIGKNGVESVINEADFQKLKENMLEKLHGLCYNCEK